MLHSDGTAFFPIPNWVYDHLLTSCVPAIGVQYTKAIAMTSLVRSHRLKSKPRLEGKIRNEQKPNGSIKEDQRVNFQTTLRAQTLPNCQSDTFIMKNGVLYLRNLFFFLKRLIVESSLLRLNNGTVRSAAVVEVAKQYQDLRTVV